MSQSEAALEIIDVCKRLSARQLVANHDGNVSFKVAPNRFLATPSGFAKCDITLNDLLVIDEKGAVLEGNHKIFSEVFWHLAIYRARPDISCVVHGHPVTASGLGLARKDLGILSIPEAIVSLGKTIQTMSFYSPLDPAIKIPGSDFEYELARVLSQSDAFLAPGNGVWAVGENILQTYLRLELVEHVAQQSFYAQFFGGASGLPMHLVEELSLKRKKSDPVRDLVRKELLDILKIR